MPYSARPDVAIDPTDPHARASYTDRIAFLVELATRLHIYGTTAQRLEGAVGAVARRLSLRCNPWSNPTGMILSFSDATTDSPLLDTTQVIRLAHRPAQAMRGRCDRRRCPRGAQGPGLGVSGAARARPAGRTARARP
jgi:hypothetical protein